MTVKVVEQLEVENEATAPEAKPNNLLGRTGRDKGFLYVAEGSRGFSGDSANMRWNASANALTAVVTGRRPTARYTSAVIPCRFPASEFLPSWNIELPREDQSFKIFLRVYDESKDKPSPWFLMGEGGAWTDDGVPVKVEAKGWGVSKIDYLKLEKPASAFQFKVEFKTADVIPAPSSADESPRLKRFFVHYSGQAARAQPVKVASEVSRACRVPVPYRSQLDVKTKKLRHIVCCPTCVAMVFEHHGIDKPTLSVCEDVYDNRHKIYGVWPRAAQAAARHGCRAWVHRFRCLDEVRAHLMTGRPVIASIRVGEGELRGARYPKSNGHLIVITGYSGKNKIRVNDPYSAGPNGGEIEYESADIEKVWLDNGGVAILIERENLL